MTTTQTKHSSSCSMTFGRKDPTCPRCQELLAGAPARPRFGGRVYLARALEVEQKSNIMAHDCKKSGCGSFCTFGDW